MSDLAHSIGRCAYCALPLPATNASNIERKEQLGASLSDHILDEAAKPQFCCFGCRFAAAVANEHGETGKTRVMLTRLGFAVFFAMNVMVFTVALWTQDVYQPDGPLGEQTAIALHSLFRYICLIFTVPVMVLLGGPMLEDLLANRNRILKSTDFLLLLGVVAAFAYSVWSTTSGRGHVYFEICCMVLVAVTLGKWLEAIGKLKTTEALSSLEKLVPDQVRIVRGSMEQIVASSHVGAEDVVRVLPGERIPVDGRVCGGVAALDTQAVTGESEPVVREVGDEVYAGTLNLDGNLLIRVNAAPGSAAVDRLVQVVKAAAAKPERYGRLADRLAQVFLPLVTLIAASTFAGLTWNGSISEGLLRALAVLVVSCPCALALATPMAIWAAFGRASHMGCVIRNAESFSRLANVDAVAVDKTGTLTTGYPEIESVLCDPCEIGEIECVAHAVASNSNHPLASAVRNFAKTRTTELPLTSTREEPGRGVIAIDEISGRPIYFGSQRLMAERHQAITTTLNTAIQKQGFAERSLVYLAWGGTVRAVYVARQQLRPSAAKAIGWLKDNGVHIHLLTGDHRESAEAIAREFRVPFTEAMLPEDKADFITQWRNSGKIVLMIGDGINDASALVVADVGLAMGCGADLSRQVADVCLLADNLNCLPELFRLSQQTVRTIRWNLLWSVLYNGVGIPLAVLGWLNPIIAAIAMSASSLLVVSNALRLSHATTDQPQPMLSIDGGANAQGVAASAAELKDSQAPSAVKGQR